MRVCHVCSLHSIDDNRVFHQECRTLAEAGYEVHLLALAPGRAPYQEQGVMVHPLPACGRLASFARRASIAGLAADLQPDLFHVHEPELLGPVLARAGSRPVIWDVHEPYLDWIMEHPALRRVPRPFRLPARAAWDWRERQLVARCAGIAPATIWVAQRYHRLHARVETIANFPDLRDVDRLPAVPREAGTCVFAGVLNPSRGLPQVLRALALLKRRGLTVTLHLAGWPSSEQYLRSLLAEARELGIDPWVHFHGALPRVEALLLMKRSSIGLVPHAPTGHMRAAIPVKMVEFMALGLPVVYSDFPNHHEIAGTAGAGIPIDVTRPETIADAIEQLVRNPERARALGEAGKRAVRDRLNWDAERRKLLELYREILSPLPQDRAPARGDVHGQS